MKQNRITRAIDIFLDAINKGTLAKGTCSACAVGNLVAKGRLEIDSRGSIGCSGFDNTAWADAFCTNENGQQVYTHNMTDPKVLFNVEQTEFTIEELIAIEFTFETNTKLDYFYYSRSTPEEIRADQIAGLSAVIKVMESFTEEQESYVEDFVERAKLLV